MQAIDRAVVSSFYPLQTRSYYFNGLKTPPPSHLHTSFRVGTLTPIMMVTFPTSTIREDI